jgi:uncharacterized membrane protein
VREKIVTWLSLFTSAGTLVCCALPALFVALGLGAAFAGLVTAVPQLIWISEHKVMVFWVAGILLVVAGVLQYQARYLSCPTDPALAAACLKSRALSKWIYAIAVLFYAIGFFFAFIVAR